MELTYQYQEPSTIIHEEDKKSLFLSHYNETYQEREVPCFFWGKLTEPYSVARSLLMLSKIVASNFMPTSTSLRDPVITAGANKLRLEGFSSCCSVYGEVTILPKAIEGNFVQQGTTNVDFNSEMIAALSQVQRNEEMFFSIGQKEFSLHSSQKKVVEKKVTLPLRWIKGMTTVQVLASEMKSTFVFDKLQIQLLFRAIPKGSVQNIDYYLSLKGKKPFLSPLKSKDSISIGAIHRLRLVEGLLPLVQKLTIFSLPSENATAFLFHLPHVNFTLMLSKSFWRGFSGEGTSLENLVEDVPTQWLKRVDNYAKIHEEFSNESSELKEISKEDFKNITTRLSSMGLLGFDLEAQCYYYRKLPFKLERVEALNPRYKNALKLIQKKAYKWIDTSSEHLETEIAGSGVTHKVVITPSQARCTCTWYATHEESRGLCKHILATKILAKHTQKEVDELLEEFGLGRI